MRILKYDLKKTLPGLGLFFLISFKKLISVANNFLKKNKDEQDEKDNTEISFYKSVKKIARRSGTAFKNIRFAVVAKRHTIVS